MPSIKNPSSSDIIKAFPHISFKESDDFKWIPTDRRIEYDPAAVHSIERLLHEIAHAELNHRTYTRDIELIGMERDAWAEARLVLALRFNVVIALDVIEDDMDTYRDWLHARSRCPKCTATGLQTGTDRYTCIACRSVWRVNAAIGCALRRYQQ